MLSIFSAAGQFGDGARSFGALAMDRLDDLGTLEKGKIADLIVLEKDPSQTIENMRSISHFMRGGLMRPVIEAFENTHDKK